MKRAAKYMLMHNGREHDERDRDRDYRRDEYDRRGEREHYGRRAEYRGNVDFAMTSGRPRREERREWDDEYGEVPELTPERAKRWTKSMQNADGSAGAHWTQEQTTQVMTQRGYHYNPATWHAIMCAMYSDFCEVAKKYGLGGNAEFYADMAHAWLDDKDAVEDKAAAYYCYVVQH